MVASKLPDAAIVAKQTRQALRRFGAEPDAVSMNDAAARVSASVVRERIVSALDRLLRQEKTAEVRALLRRVDAEAYRDEVPDAVAAHDRARIAVLAGRQAAVEQPTGFVANLGESGAISVERRRQLLHAAVSQRPGDLGLLMTLGSTYVNQKDQKDQADEQRRWFQAAVAAAPANTAAHNNLAIGLQAYGQLDEAIACFNKAIELDPRAAKTRYNLGMALGAKGRLDQAVVYYRKAIDLDPKLAEPHCNLGHVLANQGWFAESLAALKRGHELGSTQPGWSYPSAAWVREAEAKAAMEQKLPAFLRGEFVPSVNEGRMGLAAVCQAKNLSHAAAGLYASAFNAEPKLADDLLAHHRYMAACQDLRWPAPARSMTPPSSTTRKRPASASRPSTGSAPTWSCVPSNWSPASSPIAPSAADDEPLAAGHRPGRHPRRGRPGQAAVTGAEGVYPIVGRCGGAVEKGPGEVEIATARVIENR